MLIIFNFLESFTDINKSTKFKRFIYNIFIPIFLLLEYMCYLYYWKKIIIGEVFTSDEMVNFLDKNEFGYTGDKLEKADLLSTNEFFDRQSLDEAREIIKQEYIITMSELFSANIAFNIEDYISLIITTEIKIIKHNSETYRDKIYTVTIQFCRLFYLQKAKTKALVWFIFAFLLGITYFLISNHFISF